MNREKLLTPLPAGKLPSWLLRKVLPTQSFDERVLVGPGIGRDAAAIDFGQSVVVVKSDPITFASQGGEEHLIDVNANDIACMGATPRWMLVTSLLPVGTTPANVLRDFASLIAACQRRSVELVGGHTEIVPGIDRPILVGMMLGEARGGSLLQPGMAQAGDAVFLTKGLAIEGTALLANEAREVLVGKIGQDAVDVAAGYLQDPGISVVRDAETALASGGVTALHDPTEGGLATALREIAEASRLGVRLDLDAVPILPETWAICDALRLDPLGMLASGALLIAANPQSVDALGRSFERADIPLTQIGVLTDNTGTFEMVSGGNVVPLPEFAVDEVARFLATRSTPGESQA